MEINELGRRVSSALYQENSGNQWHRLNVLRGRMLDALIRPVLGEVDRENEEEDE